MTEKTAESPADTTTGSAGAPADPAPVRAEAPGAVIGRDEKGQDRHLTDRVVFFSDAVVAIAITLLALELPVPQGGTLAAIGHEMKGDLDVYAAFLIAFLLIANSWVSHHNLFALVRHVDRRAIQLNVYWLLLIVVTPFSYRFMTGGHDSTRVALSVRFAAFAVVQALVGVAVLRLARYLRMHDMLVPGATERMRSMLQLRTVVTVTFVVTVGVAFVDYRAAAVIWILIAPIVGVAQRIQRARHPAETADPAG